MQPMQFEGVAQNRQNRVSSVGIGADKAKGHLAGRCCHRRTVQDHRIKPLCRLPQDLLAATTTSQATSVKGLSGCNFLCSTSEFQLKIF
mmetsp:Transcript_252/g.530  ORF Transcript_252/g.530 Transcript_252/m.530 type:complete len:89 (-) Transcript_252:1-267(-)